MEDENTTEKNVHILFLHN